ncbi:hypothetical protein GDO81_028131 [Engystomops pustulosus]|uniref:Uncharacterized protein n=1 Tax=Engystomops pustulosus TaxID=76066 RepID=A0AAV6YNN1_ENGPU|nr:hypothetical protein GDO81_028131 [Engystomops pustulosus]
MLTHVKDVCQIWLLKGQRPSFPSELHCVPIQHFICMCGAILYSGEMLVHIFWGCFIFNALWDTKISRKSDFFGKMFTFFLLGT